MGGKGPSLLPQRLSCSTLAAVALPCLQRECVGGRNGSSYSAKHGVGRALRYAPWSTSATVCTQPCDKARTGAPGACPYSRSTPHPASNTRPPDAPGPSEVRRSAW